MCSSATEVPLEPSSCKWFFPRLVPFMSSALSQKKGAPLPSWGGCGGALLRMLFLGRRMCLLGREEAKLEIIVSLIDTRAPRREYDGRVTWPSHCPIPRRLLCPMVGKRCFVRVQCAGLDGWMCVCQGEGGF